MERHPSWRRHSPEEERFHSCEWAASRSLIFLMSTHPTRGDVPSTLGTPCDRCLLFRTGWHSAAVQLRAKQPLLCGNGWTRWVSASQVDLLQRWPGQEHTLHILDRKPETWPRPRPPVVSLTAFIVDRLLLSMKWGFYSKMGVFPTFHQDHIPKPLRNCWAVIRLRDDRGCCYIFRNAIGFFVDREFWTCLFLLE